MVQVKLTLKLLSPEIWYLGPVDRVNKRVDNTFRRVRNECRRAPRGLSALRAKHCDDVVTGEIPLTRCSVFWQDVWASIIHEFTRYVRGKSEPIVVASRLGNAGGAKDRQLIFCGKSTRPRCHAGVSRDTRFAAVYKIL
jgi:hypothetical protein